MKDIIQSIIKECADRGIPVSLTKNSSGKICYEISGFSKSGFATLFIDKGKIICETRYQTLDEIESFHDLALVAYEWYVNYKNRTPFEYPEKYWAEYWVEKGMMIKETVIVYKTI